MEAGLAERRKAMAEWNDGRLDDLSDRVDRIETKMDAGFVRLETKMDEGFARIDGRFESLHQMLLKVSWAMVVGLLGLLGVLIGVIATH
jgi:hypothetical protein